MQIKSFTCLLKFKVSFVILNANQQSTKSVDPQTKPCLPITPDPLR